MKKFIFLYFVFSVLAFNLLAQGTLDFFLDDWQPKSIKSPSFTDTTENIGSTPTTINIDFTDTVAKVSKYVYGNNGNPYSGKMNTDAKLLTYLNDLDPHVIRWPGGNLSQVYFWDRANTRPSDIPASEDFWGGKNTSQQTTDDYYDLLSKTNSTGSICVNIAYARYGTSNNPIETAAHYAAEWVRYDNGRTKFWELGNENYGNWEAGYQIDTSLNKDNQPELISGDLYGEICRVFVDSMRAAAVETGTDIKIGAVAMEALVTWDPVQMNWNPGMMAQLADKVDFYIVHSYYTPYNENSAVTTILNSPGHTQEYVNYINSGLDAIGHGPMPVALTEWNIFAIGSKQAVSYINGMQSAINVGELIKNKYGMAMKWDLSNGWSNGDDHGMFASTSETDVPFRTPHPQFHYMYYFQKYFGDKMVKDSITGNSDIMAYASSFESGQCGAVLVNKSRYEQRVEVRLNNFQMGKHYYTVTLTGGTDNGDFSRKVFINGQGPSGVAGGPSDYATIKPYGRVTDDSIKVDMPPLSVIYMIVDPATVPDIEMASATNDSVINVKLTRSVILPDTVKGWTVTLNNAETDSILKIEKDAGDSTILLLTLNKHITNTDQIILAYENGNFITYDSIDLVNNPAVEVENLLTGSSPKIIDARTDSSGSNVLVHFSKKVNLAGSNSFTININYLGSHDATVSGISFYNGDSSTYSLQIGEPLYYDYKITLSYSGTDVVSSDGGSLESIVSLPVKNFGPYKSSSVLQAFTSSAGDSIVLVFDKALLTNNNLKNLFTISLDGSDDPVKSAFVASVDKYRVIIKPTNNIGINVAQIKVSYTGTTLLSYDNVAVETFSDQTVENLVSTGIAAADRPGFEIYPNPVSYEFTIRADFRYTSVEIVDLTGKQVYFNEDKSGFPATNTISTRLEKGMYLIVLKRGPEKFTNKLLVN